MGTSTNLADFFFLLLSLVLDDDVVVFLGLHCSFVMMGFGGRRVGSEKQKHKMIPYTFAQNNARMRISH